MSRAHWETIKELFFKAAAIGSASARQRYLIEAAPNSGIAGEVTQLLMQNDCDDGPLASVGSLIGKSLLHYKVTERIGSGAMSEVFKASDSLLGRPVALKVINHLLATQQEWIQRFVSEGRCLSKVDHPNVVKIHHMAHDKESSFIVMEYVLGQTLGAMIPPHGLPLQTALDYAVQIIDALASLHAAEIIHRDLKPSNILVSNTGMIKVVDFGLAKLMNGSTGLEGNGSLTRHGEVLGTAGYIAPEYLRDQTVDARSDIFSFGAVFFEMVTRQRAFPGRSEAERNAAVLKDPPPRLGKSLPRSVRDILCRCLEKEPGGRFQEAKDVLAALTAAQAQVAALERRRRAAAMLKGQVCGWALKLSSRVGCSGPRVIGQAALLTALALVTPNYVWDIFPEQPRFEANLGTTSTAVAALPAGSVPATTSSDISVFRKSDPKQTSVAGSKNASPMVKSVSGQDLRSAFEQLARFVPSEDAHLVSNLKANCPSSIEIVSGQENMPNIADQSEVDACSFVSSFLVEPLQRFLINAQTATFTDEDLSTARDELDDLFIAVKQAPRYLNFLKRRGYQVSDLPLQNIDRSLGRIHELLDFLVLLELRGIPVHLEMDKAFSQEGNGEAVPRLF